MAIMKRFCSLLASAIAILSVVTAEAAPEVTPAPSPRLVAELLKRQLGQPGIDTCGWADGIASKSVDYFLSPIFFSRGPFIGFGDGHSARGEMRICFSREELRELFDGLLE